MKLRIVAALALAGLAAVVAWAWAWPWPPRFDMAAELARIAAAQDPWDNQFEHNAAKAAQLLAAAATETDPARRSEQRLEAARQHLLAGTAEPALVILAELADETPAADAARRELLQLELALAWLRLGESQNCIGAHNAESCLIPIRGGGLHSRRLGSEQARIVLERLLRDHPGSPQQPLYRWLLNVAAMTLGQWPDGVEARWRIPPQVFESAHALPRFQDTALGRGLALRARAGGAVLDDLDGDGALDLLVSSWGLRDPLRLFRNRGDGRFEDLGAAAGLDGLTGGLNLFQADYDNDGDLDVFVPRGAWAHQAGRIPGSLLENRGGLRFRDVTARAGVLSPLPSQAAAWCDLDNDGRLDLVKGNEIHPDLGWPAGTKNVELFRNRGGGRFEELAAAAGLSAHGMLKAVVCADYDNDGWQDLYFSRLYGPNFLFRNLGGEGKGPRFADVTAAAGVAGPDMSFTSWFFDYDNDGWQDLFVAGYRTDMNNIVRDMLGDRAGAQGERPRLYRNRGDGTFTDVARAAGVDALTLAMGANYGDLDNDGWLDFYLGTGAPPLSVLDPARMFRNDGAGRFQDVTTAGGFGHLQKGHGVAFGDIDGDGDQDVFAQVGGAFTGDTFWSVLFENPHDRLEGRNAWVTLRLQGTRSNRSAIGARIRLQVRGADGSARAIHAVVSSGGSFGASSLQQELGLGRARRIEAVEVRWPGGATEAFTGAAPGGVFRLVEGAGVAAPEPR